MFFSQKAIKHCVFDTKSKTINQFRVSPGRGLGFLGGSDFPQKAIKYCVFNMKSKKIDRFRVSPGGGLGFLRERGFSTKGN